MENTTSPNALDLLCQSIPSKNEDDIVNCLKTMFAFGSPNASYLIGMRLKTKRDDKIAFEHFQRGSEGGIADATYELALCYEEGRGVESNLEEAFIIYKLDMIRVVSMPCKDLSDGTKKGYRRRIK